MAKDHFLFCNVGWMSRYEGLQGKPDEIVGGGKWVDEHESGGEVCNFVSCPDGYVYGHVETSKGTVERRIRIELLGADPGDNYVNGVTVVWTATDPDSGGRRIVGWYRNARVFRNRQHFNSAPSRQHERDELRAFHIRARSRDKVLVPLEQRNDDNFRLGSGSGWMGHAQWWFPHCHIANNREVRTFVRRVGSMVAGVSGDDDAEEAEINSARNLTETEKKMLLKARIGQGEFRKSLEREWKKRCAVTGCNQRELLRASHIKPWSASDNSERIDRNNGLLLLASLDAAFECGLISFEDSGEMLTSPHLSADNQRLIGISKGMRLRLVPPKARQGYLRYHRSEKFWR